MRLKLSHYIKIIFIPKFSHIPESDKILFSTRTLKALRISESFIKKLQDGLFSELPERLLEILIQNEMIVPENEDELSTIFNLKVLETKDINASSTTLICTIVKPIDQSFFTSIRNNVNNIIIECNSKKQPSKHTIFLLFECRIPEINVDHISFYFKEITDCFNIYKNIVLSFDILAVHPTNITVSENTIFPNYFYIIYPLKEVADKEQYLISVSNVSVNLSLLKRTKINYFFLN